MHLEKIEEYNFEHGLHFDVVTGEYSSLNPHTLGRPLTHEEMDYNLLYQKQTVNGYRIAGSNNDLTLSADDLGKVLSFVQISNTDTDWSRWSDAGLLAGQFIWAPVEMYTTTLATTQATTIATTAATTAQTQPTTQATAATTAATQATTIATAATTAATQATTEATQATTMATQATTIATLFTMTVTPTIVTEEAGSQDTLQYKVVTSPAVPAGTTVSYTISGAWSGPGNNTPGPNGDIQVQGVNLGGGGGVSEPVPFPDNPQNPYTNTFIFDANGEAAINVYVLNDINYDEIQESVIVTLAANDSDGRPTGSISITGAINPATTIATTLATQATTLATQATTAATQATTLPPVLGYYFHGGNQSYPFVQSADGLTAANPGTMYYDDGAGNAFTSTTDLSVAMSYIMDNMGTTYSPGNYTVSSFNIPGGGIPALGSSDALNFGDMTDGGGEFYYIILPDGQVDLTSVNPQHLVDGGISTNAVQRASFTWNGDAYWLYRLGGGSQTGARTITFSDND